MHRFLMLALLASLGTPAAAADDVDALKRELEALRDAYEQRIEALERKLESVQQQQTAPAEAAAASAPRARRGISFNPDLSVVIDGAYYTDDIGGEGSELAAQAFRASGAGGGHGHGHDAGGHGHGVFERGFNLREVEIGLGAAVDPYFDAQSFISISDDGDVELEEAYGRTLSLPAGLQVKFGKFFSDITRHNRLHPHEWDWTDQNLPYQNLFGPEANLRDLGAQLTWLAPAPFYAQFGAEVFQGEQDAFGAFVDDEAREEAAAEIDEALGNPGIDEDALGLSGEESSPRLLTAFARFGPDLGPRHGLQLGAWGARIAQHQEIQELEEPDEALVLQGDGYMWGLDAVYKYSAGRSHRHGDLVLQGEYLYQKLDTRVTFSAEDPASVGESRELVTDGLYVQGWYGVWPRWRIGARYDVLGLTNEVRRGGTVLEDLDDSSRLSLALTWTPTEFSRLRLQGNFADILTEDGSRSFDGVFLQYSLTYGSHPAHRF